MEKVEGRIKKPTISKLEKIKSKKLFTEVIISSGSDGSFKGEKTKKRIFFIKDKSNSIIIYQTPLFRFFQFV